MRAECAPEIKRGQQRKRTRNNNNEAEAKNRQSEDFLGRSLP